MVFLLAFLASAFAEPLGRPVTIAVGYGGAAGPALAEGTSAGAYGIGRAVVWASRHIGADFAGREGAFANDGRVVGGLAVGLRVASSGPVYARAGFIHNHETEFSVAKLDPIGAAAGTARGIRHRAGLEVAFGADFPIPEAVLDDRLGLALELSGNIFPDQSGPLFYVCLEQHWTIDIGKGRVKAGS